MGSKSKLQTISPNPHHFYGGRITSRTTSALGKAFLRLKHRARMKVRNAFLDLQEVIAKQKIRTFQNTVRKATNGPKLPDYDVAYYEAAHNDAVADYKALVRP